MISLFLANDKLFTIEAHIVTTQKPLDQPAGRYIFPSKFSLPEEVTLEEGDEGWWGINSSNTDSRFWIRCRSPLLYNIVICALNVRKKPGWWSRSSSCLRSWRNMCCSSNLTQRDGWLTQRIISFFLALCSRLSFALFCEYTQQTRLLVCAPPHSPFARIYPDVCAGAYLYNSPGNLISFNGYMYVCVWKTH